MKNDKITAIVLAAGQGRRMNSSIQKQFMLIKGYPVLYYSLKAFEESCVDDIILVTGASEIAYCKEEIVEKYGFKKVSNVVAGGKERYDSVYNGLAAAECDYVLIHDGARPLVSVDIINRTVEAVKEYQSCTVGMPVKDTIKMVDSEKYALDTPDRSSLWQIQTPQAFKYTIIKEAHELMHKGACNGKNITDDTMLVEECLHCKTKLVEGSYSNIKVTTPEDICVAEALLS